MPGKSKSFNVFHSHPRGLVIPRFYYISKVLPENPDDEVLVLEEKIGKRIHWKGKLFPEQETSTCRLIDALRKHHGAVGQGRCGTGKTVIGTYVIAALGPRKTAILVDQRNLAEQWTVQLIDHLPELSISYIMPASVKKAIGKKYGIEAGSSRDKFDTSGDVVIIMAQTLMTRRKPFDPLPFSLLIVDEAHKFSAPRFSGSVFDLSFRYSLALTATPNRSDGLQWVFSHLLGPKIVPLAGRRVTPLVISMEVRPNEPFRPSDYKMVFCSWNRKAIAAKECRTCEIQETRIGARTSCDYRSLTEKTHYAKMLRDLSEDPSLNRAIVSMTRALYGMGHQIIVFSKFKDHLTHLQEACGIADSSLYFGGMDKDSSTEPAVTFATYPVAKHGLDVPWKSAVIMALPVSEPEQVIGRIERIHEGKLPPVVIDLFVPSGHFMGQWKKRMKFYRGAGYEHRIVRGEEAARGVLDIVSQDYQCGT